MQINKEDLDNITEIEWGGIDTSDYPDFCDAYIINAVWKDGGKELSDDELQQLNDNFLTELNENLWNYLY